MLDTGYVWTDGVLERVESAGSRGCTLLILPTYLPACVHGTRVGKRSIALYAMFGMDWSGGYACIVDRYMTVLFLCIAKHSVRRTHDSVGLFIYIRFTSLGSGIMGLTTPL